MGPTVVLAVVFPSVKLTEPTKSDSLKIRPPFVSDASASARLLITFSLVTAYVALRAIKLSQW